MMITIPNILTGLNLICGALAIFVMMLGRIDLVPFLLAGSFIFDFLDGLAARVLKQKSEIGKQLDSLADMVSFGLAPGILMMIILCMDVEGYVLNAHYEEIQFDITQWFHSILNGQSDFYLPFVALIIPFLSLFRLAKFNLDQRQSTSFIGLPTPAHTAFYLFFPLILMYDRETLLSNWDSLQIIFDPNLLTGIIVLTSFALISEIPLFSFKKMNLKWKDSGVQMIFLLISLVLILFLRYWSLPLIVLLYVILSIIVNTFKKRNNEIQSGN